MNKEQVYEFLKKHNIDFEITEHEAMFHMSDEYETILPYPEADAKNIFIRDKKKENYYLITVKGNKRVDLKEFKKQQGTTTLSFAAEDDLMKYLGVTPGSVSPFGLFNDNEKKVAYYFDSDFFEGCGLIGCHPNDNTATVWLKAEDMISLISEHGTSYTILKL